jgi:hypothetical protein
MMKKTVKSYDTFALLSLTLILMFSMVTLAPANAVSHTDGGKEGGDEKEKSHSATANGAQVNLCDASDGACIQANEDQSASGGDNRVVGFNDQSGTSAPNNDKAAAEEAGNSTDFVMKIDGIDYSTVKVKVWVTADGGREISKTFNPVPLLDPEDDDRGLIFVPMKAEKGLLDIGDAYTACIKVIEDTDKYGNKQSCQQSVLTLMSPQEVSNSINPPASSSSSSSSAASDSAASAEGVDDDDDGGGGTGALSSDDGGGGGVAVMRITL